MHQEQIGIRLGYQPALDGLRGIAVLSVLLYHGEVSWMAGGYLGVSTFFTLSGFLITSLLLAERSRSGRIDLGSFYVRRLRRLLPAALLCLAGIVVFGATVATPSQLVDLRADVLSALGYVANWRLVLSGSSYADLFTAPSPIQHFWSLAIEEQFYLVMPLVVLGLLAVGKGSWRFLAGAFAVLAALSVGLSIVLYGTGASLDRIYFGTDTRAAELLLGALLAVLVSIRGSFSFDGAAGQRVRAVGAGALLFTLVLWATVGLDQPVLYYGGFGLYGLVTVAVVLGAVQPGGLVRTALAWRPLVLVGLVSYGAYLYHWPIYLWLTPERTGLDGVALLGLRLAVTAAAAIASYLLVEKPIRAGESIRGRWTPWIAVPASISLVAVAAVAVTIDPPTDQVVDLAAAQEEVSALPGTGSLVPNDPGAARVAFFGDSVALTIAAGAAAWDAENTGAVRVAGGSELGCGIGRFGQRVDVDRSIIDQPDCWGARWGDAIERNEPDVAVVLSGPWDLTDRRLLGDDRFRALGDPVYDDYLRDEIQGATDLLRERGLLVLWLTTPEIELGATDGVAPEPPHPASDPARAERFNQLLRETVGGQAGVEVLDMADYVATLPEEGFAPDVRPDGVHFSDAAAERLVSEWLGPQIDQAWARWQASGAQVPG